MNTQIKEYKKLTEIETFKGIYYTSATPEQVDELVETRKFIQIGGKRIAIHQIIGYGEETVGPIQSYIFSHPKHIQDILKAREKQKFNRVGKNFESVEEIQRFLESKKLLPST